MLTVLDLFSGIGGFSLGLERTGGFKTVAFVEKDRFCQRVLAKHWPGVPIYDDIYTAGAHNLPAVDVVAGGFPCQPFSVAGQQRGEADDRNLWPEMRRVIAELRPRWVVAENVVGIFGLYLDTVLAQMEAEGYEAWAADIPAVAFDAPHIRHRLWIVAHAEREQPKRGRVAGDVAGEAGGGEGKAGQWQRVRDAAGDSGAVVAHANGERLEKCHPAAEPDQPRQSAGSPAEKRRETRWPPEPSVCRVADGIPDRVDRLRALGNAVVPQVVEHIGRALLAVEANR